MLQFDLQNGNNWEEIYSGTRAITRTGLLSYIPIGEIEIPILVEKSILAFYCESPSALDHWTQGGWLRQKIRLGLTPGGMADGHIHGGRLMLLKKIMLVQFQGLGGSYQISFKPKRHLEDIIFRIWQYTGAMTDSLEEKIDLTRLDVQRIEKKIEFIAQRDVTTTYDIE